MSSTTLDVVGGGQGDCFFEEYQEPDGTVSVRLKKRYSGLWTDGFLASLGRRAAEEDSGGSALLFEPLASINEASLDMPQEAGVGIVWNGRRWEYGRTGGGFSTISKVSEGVLRWSDSNGGEGVAVNFIHTHAFADITGKPTTLAGYGITDAYTMTQVDALLAQKVDVSWFRSLFRAYASGGSEILPNASGTIDNIQSMLGFWTNQYISALGRGSAGSTLLDETMLWSLLGNSDTTKQISLSHLQAALSSYAQTANVITRVAKNPDGDGRIDFVSQSQTVTVDFIHTHSWAQITGQPTKLSQFQNDVPYATAAELSSTVSTAIAALSFYNSASWNSTSLKLTLSGQNASKEVTLSHSHDVYLGTTKLTTGNASGSVTAVTGLGTINTDALVLRQITYNSATVNAVGIGGTPSYPLDVSGLARFRSGIKLSASGANAVLDISNSNMTFSGNGYVTQYIRKGTAYLALSSSGSGEYGLVVYNTNEVRFSAGAWSDTYLSALGQNTSSDRRLKTELGKVSLKVSDIAAAPMVRYLWTGKPWLGEQVGSYAQAWQPLLPEAVKNGHDGYLEMQYGVIALL
ncbi:MAG: tail fiber domain-containing protein, partial [Bacteroidales bacterium]|nr:tail fiber domain-containing protein [Bacteroidales bacterium]